MGRWTPKRILVASYWNESISQYSLALRVVCDSDSHRARARVAGTADTAAVWNRQIAPQSCVCIDAHYDILLGNLHCVGSYLLHSPSFCAMLLG